MDSDFEKRPIQKITPCTISPSLEFLLFSFSLFPKKRKRKKQKTKKTEAFSYYPLPPPPPKKKFTLCQLALKICMQFRHLLRYERASSINFQKEVWNWYKVLCQLHRCLDKFTSFVNSSCFPLLLSVDTLWFPLTSCRRKAVWLK